MSIVVINMLLTISKDEDDGFKMPLYENYFAKL